MSYRRPLPAWNAPGLAADPGPRPPAPKWIKIPAGWHPKVKLNGLGRGGGGHGGGGGGFRGGSMAHGPGGGAKFGGGGARHGGHGHHGGHHGHHGHHRGGRFRGGRGGWNTPWVWGWGPGYDGYGYYYDRGLTCEDMCDDSPTRATYVACMDGCATRTWL